MDLTHPWRSVTIRLSNARLKRAAGDRDLKLHLGCGARLLDGWMNIDIARRPGVVWMQLPGDLEQLGDGSARYIYASHLLEHIGYPDEALELLRHCHRILAPGGTVRLMVPDIELIIRAYAAADEEFFERQREFHPDWCVTKLDHLMYALQQDGEHRYGYDYETLKRLLESAGFEDIERRSEGESRVDELRIDYRDELEGLNLVVEAVR